MRVRADVPLLHARAGVHMGKVLLEIGGSQERLNRQGVHPAVRGPLQAAPGQDAAPADVEVANAPIQVSRHAGGFFAPFSVHAPPHGRLCFSLCTCSRAGDLLCSASLPCHIML